MKTSRSLISFLLLFLISSVAAQNYWEDFPVRANPKTVGDKLSKRFWKVITSYISIEEYIMLKCVLGMVHLGLPS